MKLIIVSLLIAAGFVSGSLHAAEEMPGMLTTARTSSAFAPQPADPSARRSGIEFI